MVQAIGEGVEMLKRCDWDLDLAALFHNWNHGSVIRSWLVELMETALRSKHDMPGVDPYVEDTASSAGASSSPWTRRSRFPSWPRRYGASMSPATPTGRGPGR